MAWLGFMCGSGIFVGGFLENMQGKIKVKDYMFLQGSKSKTAFSSSTFS
jgi:hypothetical protein